MEIAVNPLPCGEISRAAFIGTGWQIDAARFEDDRKSHKFSKHPICCRANQLKVVPYYNTVKASVVQCDTVILCRFL